MVPTWRRRLDVCVDIEPENRSRSVYHLSEIVSEYTKPRSCEREKSKCFVGRSKGDPTVRDTVAPSLAAKDEYLSGVVNTHFHTRHRWDEIPGFVGISFRLLYAGGGDNIMVCCG